MTVLQIKHGEKFESATDTEVIPKLCKYVYNNLATKVSFDEVCQLSLSQSFTRHH